MLIKNNLILFFILLLFPISISAKMGEFQVSPLQPIEWQAITLQENIEGKIIRSLNPIIKESEYVIEVKIDIDLDKAEDPSSKKITKTQQSKKIKFSTNQAPKEGDDFVVFNKLGLEAPIIGEEGIETTTSEVELAQKAMIEMNDRYNLFNFLKGIEVKLTFDNGLSKKTRENIQKVIRGLSFNTKDIIPQINLQYLELKDSRVKSEENKVNSPLSSAGGNTNGTTKVELPKNNHMNWDERFKNLDIMLGIILGAVVLGLVAIFISKKGSKLDEHQESKNENINEESPIDSAEELADDNTNEGDELIENGDDMSLDLTKTDAQTLKIVAGLERFRKMMSMHFNDMILLIKGWIKVGKGAEAIALKGLVATLTDTELAEIFKALTIDERNTWKMCLDSEMNKEELAKSFTIISNKIIEAMMVPSLIDDYEICDLLLALSSEDASRFCIDHPELGAIFANVLSAKTIGEMFALMPVQLTTEIIENSSMFRKEEVIAQMPLLKEKLLEVKFKRERPPFLARIFDILPTARPEIEKQLYSTLIKHCLWEDVKSTAINIFPAELIRNLPENIFRNVIGLMPLESQVAYFAVQSENERDEALDRFAPKGSKSREMVDFEVTALLSNEVALRRLQGDRKLAIEADYLSQVRSYINSSSEAQVEIRSDVEAWLRKIENEANMKARNIRDAA
jgi:hypothetical protein